MAHNSMLLFPANTFVGDNNAQLVGGDAPAILDVFVGRPVLAFDDTDEAAAITPEVQMPGAYAGGTLKVDIFFFTASDNTNDLAIDVYVEAKTSGDTLDMASASSWDTANSGTVSVGGSTVGDPLKLTITLTNKDSVVAGDQVRFGIRRDADSVDDDISGDVYITSIEIWEDA